MIKGITSLLALACLASVWPVLPAQAAEPFPRWTARFDMGGTIPEEADLTEVGGPVSGEKFKLDPGFQFDLSGGYRPTSWLEVGPELGFTFNSVDSIGGWSYPDTTLGQILLMANVRLEYPVRSRVAPFVGAGIGGVASFLTFGGGYGYAYGYDYDYEPDGTGSDFTPGFQLFGGVRYRVGEKWSLGLEYRYLATGRQDWDVRWWNGREFGISVDSIRMHSVCLVLEGRF
jgi:opacity protein-like surface antigen